MAIVGVAYPERIIACRRDNDSPTAGDLFRLIRTSGNGQELTFATLRPGCCRIRACEGPGAAREQFLLHIGEIRALKWTERLRFHPEMMRRSRRQSCQRQR